MYRVNLWSLIVLGAAAGLVGCASAPTIQPAAGGRSRFEGAVYSGETATIASGAPGSTEYRVFRQGATGFVSIQSVRADAEQAATEFCDRKGKSLNPLREAVAKPPFILGNFPRIEIIFECADRAQAQAAPVADDAKYAKLIALKKLLDTGVLTQDEFDREKAKILTLP
jgi:putative oligomerization/nucleic acid binding protein